MTRSFTRGRTATAVAGAVAGGSIIAIVPINLDVTDAPTGFLSVALATTVSLTAVKRWLGQYEERTKADVRSLAEQHLHRSQELDRRERALNCRERAAARRAETEALRLAGLVQNLDEARNLLAVKTTAHEALQAAYAEVRTDYNALIEHCLRQGSDRFTSHTQGVYEPRPHQGREHQRDPSPTPVTLLYPREHHPSA